ncbi:hypothetical protein GUJ93_ZPchr0001g29768 [Zizania palustris]|uniref:Oxidoreductase FAD/NAD(P)-binding domain-containing protein n=1 Tax=Zizania palustris TaxID=103762 RepID=A0A8J5RXV6_ZIZPA|nr:hypothetical protein GUJ93_ZPchr0001g29768 [Zizania palustris]
MLLRSAPRHLHLHLRLRLHSTAAAAAVATPAPPPRPTEWTEAPVSSVRPATADSSLFHVSLDLSSHVDLLASHRLPGTPSARLCDLRPGDLVHVGGSVIGRGFEVGRIADARDVLVFATGSGISPIRSLIESGFGENKHTDVSLFYGVRNLQRMAYQERFSNWESRGIKIIPVLSRPDDQWTGERGYVQNAFSRMNKVVNPSSMGAILCGHKQMSEEITRALVADGMSKDRILTNF